MPQPDPPAHTHSHTDTPTERAPTSPARLFRLELLGGMRLLPPPQATAHELERTALLDNRRRIVAVLATLAVSPRPLSRDQLADFFWSDTDQARARHSLSEALRLLRRVLGTDVVTPRAADLSLSADSPLTTDVAEFLAAHSAQRHDQAVALYTGDFLDGIHVERAPRFDDWADRLRESLRQQFAHSCRAECTRLTQSGQHGAAASVARRWLDVQPLSFDAADAWLRGLLAPGTTEAVHAAQERFAQYTAQLHADYEAAPDNRLLRLLRDAEQSLAARQAHPAPHDTPPQPARPITPPAGATRVTPPPAPAVPTAVPTPPAAHVASTPRTRTWPRVGALAATAAAAALAAWQYGLFDETFAAAVRGRGDERAVVVVADAEHTTSDTLLAAAVTLATSTALNESGALRVLPAARVSALRAITANAAATATGTGTPTASSNTPQAATVNNTTTLTEPLARTIAVRAGANAVVVPVLVAMGPRYRVALRIVAATDGATLATIQSRDVSQAELLPALDGVIRQVRRRFGGSRAEMREARALPDFTTSSIPALQAYVAGGRAFNAERYPDAVDGYREAIRLDPGFALAWYALGRTLYFQNRPQAGDSAFTRAEATASRLTDREQVIMRAGVARARGQRDSAIAVRGRWLALHDDDIELAATQVFDLFTAERHEEAVRLGERLIRRDSLNPRTMVNVSLAYDAEDPATRRKAVALYARAISIDSTITRSALFTQQYGSLLVRAALYDSAAAVFTRAGAQSVSLRGRASRSLGQLELWRGRAPAAVPHFATAVQASWQAGDTLSAARSRLWLAASLRLAGDTVAARAQEDTLARDAVLLLEPAVQYWIGQHLVRAGRLPLAARVLSALEQRVVPNNRVHAADRTLLQAELAAGRGAARGAVAGLAAAARGDSSAISLETFAWVSLQAGDTATARSVGRTLATSRANFGFENWLALERVRGWLPALERRPLR